MTDLFTISYIIQGIVYQGEENPFVEFKQNNADPDEMGEYISALSNMALLYGVPFGYLIWGVDDKTKSIVGTTLSFKTWKKGGQEILAYWKSLLTPTIVLENYELLIENKKVLALRIPAATHFQTTFKKQAYCRIESSKKNLKEFPSLEKQLWQKLEETSPERRIVETELQTVDVKNYLDFPSYYNKLNLPTPQSEKEWVSSFLREGFINKKDGDMYAISAYGALLFGKNITQFHGLENKGIRIIRYHSDSRLETMGKQEFNEGYAISFQKAYLQILNFLQAPDKFEDGLRRDQYFVPTIAIREALGNALIHQDLLSYGGPLVEIFPNRIEFSNPGELNVPINRLIDSSPNPRNEKLASFLRRINIGDTAGSGFDKIVSSLENVHFPPAKVEQTPTGVRVVLFFNKPFEEFTAKEKLQATYEHVVLRYISSNRATNKSLRERFGLEEKAKYQISRLFAQAVENGLIKKEPNSDKKDASYIPYWA